MNGKKTDGRIEPRKSLGQNFLTDGNTARKIVSSLRADASDMVVEIGAGTGALTALLAEAYPRLLAVEIDDRAVDVLRTRIPGVRIVETDVLKLVWREIAGDAGGTLHVIGNLPYYITSQILFGLLDEEIHISEAVLMMQYEVAQRLVAQTSTKAYGILSVAVQLVAEPRILFPVSRNVFYPRPDVRSAIVHLDFESKRGNSASESGSDGHSPEFDARFIRRVIRSAFNQRRKRLRNSLKGICEEVGKELEAKYAHRRAEELTPEDFVDLARYLQADL